MTAVSNRKRKRFNGLNILRYPYTMFVDGTDYLQIDMMDYIPLARATGREAITTTRTREVFTGPFLDPEKAIGQEEYEVRGEVNSYNSYTKDPNEGFRRNTNKQPLGTVLLPVPSNIQDGNTVNYSDDTMNALVGAGLGLSMGVMQNVGALVGEGNFVGARDMLFREAQGALGESGLNFEQATSLITKQLAGSALSILGGNVSIDQIQARESGQIFNPNMELLFNGPSL